MELEDLNPKTNLHKQKKKKLERCPERPTTTLTKEFILFYIIRSGFIAFFIG